MLITSNKVALAKQSLPVTPDEDLSKLIADLTDTVFRYNGVGLAANQIGQLKRVFVIRTPRGIEVIKNPKITEQSDMMIRSSEGCLSFPGQEIRTRRWNEVKLVDMDHPAGRWFRGKPAFVIQHEVDHLDGFTLFDREYKPPAVGRNDICPCGSGKKYKKCCGL